MLSIRKALCSMWIQIKIWKDKFLRSPKGRWLILTKLSNNKKKKKGGTSIEKKEKNCKSELTFWSKIKEELRYSLIWYSSKNKLDICAQIIECGLRKIIECWWVFSWGSKLRLLLRISSGKSLVLNLMLDKRSLYKDALPLQDKWE